MNPKRRKRHEKGLLTIGEIAKEFGILSSQVRYYTRLGLLREETRTQGRYRLYRKEETLSCLKEILRLKKEGLSLGQIRKRIGPENKSDKPLLLVNGTEQKMAGAFREYPVKFAYLFGSHAKGATTNLSDIDIAVYLDEALDSNERFDLRLKLIGRMGGIFRTDRMDLVILNDVSASLSFQVITYGKIIYCKDELGRIRYEARTTAMYFDQQYYYNRHNRLSIARIAKEGIL